MAQNDASSLDFIKASIKEMNREKVRQFLTVVLESVEGNLIRTYSINIISKLRAQQPVTDADVTLSRHAAQMAMSNARAVAMNATAACETTDADATWAEAEAAWAVARAARAVATVQVDGVVDAAIPDVVTSVTDTVRAVEASAQASVPEGATDEVRARSVSEARNAFLETLSHWIQDNV